MCEVLVKALGPRPDHPVNGTFIAAQLSQAVLKGDLPIGTKVSQQVIADHYDVSRMPVREALRCVQAQGLISHVPNHTSVVIATSPSDETELVKSLAREASLQSKLNEALRLMCQALPYLSAPPAMVQTGADDLAREFTAFCSAHEMEVAIDRT